VIKLNFAKFENKYFDNQNYQTMMWF